MDAHRDRTLSDDLLDREIAAVLDVEPSPEFRARVRARVAAEGEHVGAPWWRSLAWTGAAAAVAIAIAGTWLMWGREAALVAPAQVVERVPASAPPPAPSLGSIARGAGSGEQDPAYVVRPQAGAPVPAPALARAPRIEATPAVRNAPAVTARNEVVVSPDDATALRRLVAAVSARQVKASDIPPFGGESAPLPAIEEIVLEPITLSPIAGLDSE